MYFKLNSWELLLPSCTDQTWSDSTLIKNMSLLACFFAALKRGLQQRQKHGRNAIKSLDHLNRRYCILHFRDTVLVQLTRIPSTSAAPRMLGSYLFSKHLWTNAVLSGESSSLQPALINETLSEVAESFVTYSQNLFLTHI